ncbi:cell wall-binding repeat-containing protein [Clostridium sp. PL3]|uniref:Cell wall-binding repeat-containing protein n=1 Tax=Clostridium thailandense TaxID=2794346 RepID=A0A949TLF7_9CLOT|nr:cell wall-binding repeat-containing protein [Clostridium thailandense]MBV7274500.1 cell wall-binding repeat-containing protein [Clostridium thailandense]
MKRNFKKGISILAMLLMLITQFVILPQVAHAAVTTWHWEDITGSSSNFSSPYGIAIDESSGVKLFVTDSTDKTVKQSTGNGTWTTMSNFSYTFVNPGHISLWNPYVLYVVDNNSTIVRSSYMGMYSWNPVTSLNAPLPTNPNGVFQFYDGNDEHLYVTDTANPTAKLWHGVGGNLGYNWNDITQSGSLSNPGGIDADSSGNLYIADTGNNKIQKVTSSSSITYTDIAGGSLNGPMDVVADSSGTNLYVADTGNHKIKQCTLNGSGTPTWTDITGDLPATVTPYGIETDSSGNVYITDHSGGKVYKGAFMTVPAPTVTAVNPSSGSTAGGTTVTITGTGFTGATAVNFGSTTASSITVDSDTQITATVPAGSAGAVDVTVTTPNGTSATSSADQYTYTVSSTTGSGICFTGDSPQIDSNASASNHGVSTVTIQDVSGNVLQVDDNGGDLMLDTAANYHTTTPTGMSGNYFSLYDTDQWIEFSVQGGKTFDFNSIQLMNAAGSAGLYVFAPNSDMNKSVAFSFNTNESKNIDLSSNPDFKNVTSVKLMVDGTLDANFDNIVLNFPSAAAAPAVTTVNASSCGALGGRLVTITGTGFTGATAVKFGINASTDFTVISDTEIEAKVPADTAVAGVVDVTVTTPDGTSSAGSADKFTYIPEITNVSPSSGSTSGGTTVIITGGGFTGATAVKFGNTPATAFHVDSDTQITATAPAGSAGWVDVTVTTQYGTSALVDYDGYDYIPVATPTVTAVSPSNGSTAGGTTVTITGTGFTGATAVNFGGTAATNFTVVSDTEITATAPAGSAGAVDITVTTAGGTSSTSSADQYTYIAPASDGGGSSPYIPPTPPTPTKAVTGDLVDDKGEVIKGIPAQATTETDGTQTVAIKSQDAVVVQGADGTKSPLTDLTQIGFSTPDSSGNTQTVSVSIAADGTIEVKGLANNTETKFNVTYDLGNGQKIIIGNIDVTVSSSGDIKLESCLIDPYGTITDAATGQVISEVNLTLYYANTDRNKAAGKTPDTMVVLPGIDGFKPNDNKDPQISDANGTYGWMVFPNSDYYIVATKDGYSQYTSPTISVEQEIVKWDFKMNAISTNINPSTGDFDKNVSNQADISTTMTLNGANLVSITNGINTLVNGTDYTVNNNVVTITKAYLAKQSVGTTTLNFNFSAGSVQVLVITIKDTTPVYTGGSGGGGGGSAAPVTPVAAAIQRLSGEDRVDTALAIAKATYAGKVSKVILASSENYPDALTGSVLAYKLNAPILLGGSDEADQDKILAYLKDNMDSTGTVYVLGGTGVVSKDMEVKINGIGFQNITRLGGADRFETTAKIADTLGAAEGTPIVIVSGENYPDALSISSIAAMKQYPIFMVNKNEIPEIEKKAISLIKPSKVYIIGAEGVVSREVEDQVAKIAAIDKTNIVRIGGSDRFETSLNIIQNFDLSGNTVCIASGNNFPDAVAGSVYAANNGAPMMLVDSSLTEAQKTYLKNAKLKTVTIFGGTGVVSAEVQNEIYDLLSK